MDKYVDMIDAAQDGNFLSYSLLRFSSALSDIRVSYIFDIAYKPKNS